MIPTAGLKVLRNMLTIFGRQVLIKTIKDWNVWTGRLVEWYAIDSSGASPRVSSNSGV